MVRNKDTSETSTKLHSEMSERTQQHSFVPVCTAKLPREARLDSSHL